MPNSKNVSILIFFINTQFNHGPTVQVYTVLLSADAAIWSQCRARVRVCNYTQVNELHGRAAENCDLGIVMETRAALSRYSEVRTATWEFSIWNHGVNGS